MPLISPPQITLFTIVIGPAIAALIVLYGLCKCRPKVDSDFVIVMISNGISLVPIICLIYNLVGRVYAKSYPDDSKTLFTADASHLSGGGIRTVEASVGPFMEGSETTVFLALMYAAILMLVSIYRNVTTQR